jgi:hypothetical protein
MILTSKLALGFGAFTGSGSNGSGRNTNGRNHSGTGNMAHSRSRDTQRQAGVYHKTSLVAEQAIECPAAAYVLLSGLTVGDDFSIATPCVKQSVPQNRYLPPPPLIIDGLGHPHYEPVVPGED